MNYNNTKTACTLLPYSILDLIKVDTTYLRTVILTASCYYIYEWNDNEIVEIKFKFNWKQWMPNGMSKCGWIKFENIL